MSGSNDEQSERRIARRHQHTLGDACRLIECANTILRRDNIHFPDLDRVREQIRKQELSAMQRAEGPLEPRKRYKAKSPNVALEQRPLMNLYLDESGTSTKFTTTSPNGHSVFAVGAVAMTESAATTYVKKADDLKRKYWGETDVTFHEPFMRKHSEDFRFGGDALKQQAFDSDYSDLLKQTKYVCFGAIIRKAKFQSDYSDVGRDSALPTDAYSLAIALILERFVDFLAHEPKRYRGKLLFESQGPPQDADHQLSYATVLTQGTRFIAGSTFLQWLMAGCEFVPKIGSHPVEIADTWSRDLYEWGFSECKVPPLHWQTFCKKTYCRESGLRGTFGVKVFPGEDLLDDVYAHRSSCGAKLTS